MQYTARSGPAHDPLGQARTLVEDTLTALLDLTATADQEHRAGQRFVTALEQLVDALAERPETAAAVPALTAAADHLRVGELADARDELINARGALTPATARPDGPAVEVCDVCERVPPAWSVPVTGTAVAPPAGPVLPGLATDGPTLLVCAGCRDLIVDTTTDGELADLLGLDRLPRTLRGVHSRIAGPPTPWPTETTS